MSKQHSWTRQTYASLYRSMRRGVQCEDMLKYWHEPKELVQAADYSYQAYDCKPHGWSSHRRYRAFLHMKWRIITKRGELPF